MRRISRQNTDNLPDVALHVRGARHLLVSREYFSFQLKLLAQAFHGVITIEKYKVAGEILLKLGYAVVRLRLLEPTSLVGSAKVREKSVLRFWIRNVFQPLPVPDPILNYEG